MACCVGLCSDCSECCLTRCIRPCQKSAGCLHFSPDNYFLNTPKWTKEEDEKYTDNEVLVFLLIEGIKLCAAHPSKEQHNEQGCVYNIPSPSAKHIDTMVIKDYEFEHFEAVKKLDNIDLQSYLRSWTFNQGSIPSMFKGAGKSGSWFLRSRDGRYIMKTIPQHEAHTLRNMMPAYCNYLRANRQSRLARLFGLHRILYKGIFQYIFISNNIFYSPSGLKVHTKYDLKGRVPKASSLKHRDRLAKPMKGVWKDNQLDRKFYPDTPATLLEAIALDAAFLQKQNCIDYSLLVGVHDESRVGDLITEEEELKAEHVDVTTRRSSLSRTYSFSVIDRVVGVGIPSSKADQPEVYFVGIVDFLARYHLKKKTSHFFKRLLWAEATLSTVNPSYYAHRFIAYLPEIFGDDHTKPGGGEASRVATFKQDGKEVARKVDLPAKKDDLDGSLESNVVLTVRTLDLNAGVRPLDVQRKGSDSDLMRPVSPKGAIPELSPKAGVTYFSLPTTASKRNSLEYDAVSAPQSLSVSSQSPLTAHAS